MVADARHCARGRLYEHEEPRRAYKRVQLLHPSLVLRPIPYFFSDGTEITLTQDIRYLEEPYKARSVMGHT